MSPCSGPLGSTLTLKGAVKWGTVWTSNSIGTGIIKGQSWTFVFYQVNFKGYFKAPINVKVEPRGPEHCEIFFILKH